MTSPQPAPDLVTHMRTVGVPISIMLVTASVALELYASYGGDPRVFSLAQDGLPFAGLRTMQVLLIVSALLFWLSKCEALSIFTFYICHVAVIVWTLHSVLSDATSSPTSLAPVLVMPVSCYAVRVLFGLSTSVVARVERFVMILGVLAVVWRRWPASDANARYDPGRSSVQAATFMTTAVGSTTLLMLHGRMKGGRRSKRGSDGAAQEGEAEASPPVEVEAMESGCGSPKAQRPSISTSWPPPNDGAAPRAAPLAPRPLVRVYGKPADPDAGGDAVLEVPTDELRGLTVAELKARIREATGLAEEQQALQLRGQQGLLDEDTEVIASLPVEWDSDVVLMVRPRERDDDSICGQAQRSTTRRPTF